MDDPGVRGHYKKPNSISAPAFGTNQEKFKKFRKFKFGKFNGDKS